MSTFCFEEVEGILIPILSSSGGGPGGVEVRDGFQHCGSQLQV